MEPIEAALVLAAAVAFLILPGLAFTFGAGGRGRPPLEWLALGFGTSVAVAAVLSDVVHFFGGNVVWLSALYVGLTLAVIPAGLWRPPAHPESDTRDWLAIGVVVMALSAAGLAIWQGLNLAGTADTFYHVQAARSLLTTGSTRVTDMFFGGTTLPPDPTAGTWPSMIAQIALFTGVDPLPVARVLSPLMAFLVLPCFYALVRRFGASAPAALGATAAFLIGGLALEFRTGIYPSRVAPLVLFAGLIWLVEWLKLGDWRRAVAAVVTLAGAATVHLSVAEAMIFGLVLAAVAAALWRTRDALRLLAILLAVVVLFGALAWPSLLPLTQSRTLGVAGVDAQDDRSEIPVWEGPIGLALVPGLGLPSLGPLALVLSLFAAIALWIQGRDDPRAMRAPPIGFAAVLPALMLNGLLTGFVVNRFWYHLIRLTVVLKFAPYAALAVLIPDRRRWSKAGEPWQIVYVVACIGLTGLAITHAVGGRVAQRFAGPTVEGSVAHSHANDRSVALAPVVNALEAQGAHRGTVVAAPTTTSYELSGLAGYHVVAVPASHMPVAVIFDDADERLAAAEILYARDSLPDERAAVLARYQVELAVLPAELAAAYVETGWRKVGSVGELRIFAP